MATISYNLMKCNHLQFDKCQQEKPFNPTGFTLYVFKNFFLQSAVTSSLPSRKLRPVTHGKSKTHGKKQKTKEQAMIYAAGSDVVGLRLRYLTN